MSKGDTGSSATESESTCTLGLARELDKRARKGKLDAMAVTDKRSALLVDRAAKFEAFSARFLLRIELMPIPLRAIEVESGVGQARSRSPE